MIICKACELKQEPITRKCRRCGKGLIPEGELPDERSEAFKDALPFVFVSDSPPIVALAKLEREAVENAVRQCYPNQAAEMLGIGKTTLYRYIKKYNLVPKWNRDA